MTIFARVRLKSRGEVATRDLGEHELPQAPPLGHSITLPVDDKPTRLTVLQVLDIKPFSAQRPLIVVQRATP